MKSETFKHYLSPSKERPLKKKIWSFDTEDDSKGNVKLLGFYNGKVFKVFESRSDALKFLYNLPVPKNQTWYFYAHNLEYDIINLFKGHWGGIEYIKWNMFVICAKMKWKNIVFLDSMNLCYPRISLKELGKIIDLPKLDFDPESIEYLKRDCEIVFEYVTRLQDMVNAEYSVSLKYTIPSTSFAVWRKNFFNYRVERNLDPAIFDCYFGGRTEAFSIGQYSTGINYADVNSMYPKMMLNDYPDTGSLKPIDSLSTRFGYGKFTVESDENIPLLPVRVKNKIYFPKGQFTGVWTFEEVRTMQDMGAGQILETHWAYGTDIGFPYFRDFAKHFYEKKRDAKDIFYTNFYKLFLNSLYGKFGERLEGAEFVPLESLERGNGEYEVKKIFGNSAIVNRFDSAKSKNSNPLWAAYVTAYSRVYLWSQLNYVAHYARLIYCDTDSIIYQGRPNLLKVSKRMGDWKIEKYKQVHVKGAKFYKLTCPDGKIYYRIKGIPVTHQEMFFDFGVACFQNPIKFREALMIGNLTENQTEQIMNYWTDIQKEYLTSYDKRRVLPDGSTEPINIEEIEIKLKEVKPMRQKIYNLRTQILDLGGIKYSKDIPKWFFRSYFYLFRRQGNTIDEVADMLNGSGWNFDGSDDLIEKINSGYLNSDISGFQNYLLDYL